ncbi:hypothetical protein B0T25DRAFT_608162 [Lasiosphaeria hispida]|uniref:Prolyl 4-hydroxylase alpha subunit Fe(2+) 2OG dioxygenase domain-containing protein n=1 Tax=Lasiosphaeria hispida TaxID=260671 RepID=A0AAJ0HJK2_9PEZI|nr:hypothetical protein B0T25DRAFT_608162 [Lasiosphaeria hispida]
MSNSDFSSDISLELGKLIASRSSTCAWEAQFLWSQGKRRRKDAKAKNIDDAKGGVLSTPPITLRWDSPKGNISKITFPITDKTSFRKLLLDCEPAGFGYKDSDVLDKNYRNAAKRDRSDFSSDLCPYELGLIDTVAQVLLPSIKEGISAEGVRAELYALNIYSAPSGFFKSHVGTPRSESQFGSLVPSVLYDWSTSAAGTDAVHWAAFYSDCEHEVGELSQGHRATLTYNLLKDLDEICPGHTNPEFMRDDGVLGVHCTHAYAHSTRSGGRALPTVLKGADMAMYAARTG